MNKLMLTANLAAPTSRLQLVRTLCAGKDVLDVGCINHDLQNKDSKEWLHSSIRTVAKSTLGVDYLEHEIGELAKLGYRVIAADVTKPIQIDEKFDVIVVGNLIEHLSNFEGLMLNIERLMKPGGCALISTANPFFREQYFYSAFKNDIIVNQEHTCWLDPITLDQLSQRFGLITDEVHWIKEKWKLGQVILNGESRSIDIFTSQWRFHNSTSKMERAIAPILSLAFKVLAPRKLVQRVYAKHGDLTARLLYLHVIGPMFEFMWSIYRRFIVTSPINEHELFVSILKRKV